MKDLFNRKKIEELEKKNIELNDKIDCLFLATKKIYSNTVKPKFKQGDKVIIKSYCSMIKMKHNAEIVSYKLDYRYTTFDYKYSYIIDGVLHVDDAWEGQITKRSKK